MVPRGEAVTCTGMYLARWSGIACMCAAAAGIVRVFISVSTVRMSFSWVPFVGLRFAKGLRFRGSCIMQIKRVYLTYFVSFWRGFQHLSTTPYVNTNKPSVDSESSWARSPSFAVQLLCSASHCQAIASVQRDSKSSGRTRVVYFGCIKVHKRLWYVCIGWISILSYGKRCVRRYS